MCEGILWSAVHPLHGSMQVACRAAYSTIFDCECAAARAPPPGGARPRVGAASLPARLPLERPVARRQALLLAVRLWGRLPAELAAACALLPAGTPPPPPDFFTAGERRGAHAAPDAAAAFFTRAHLQARLRARAARPAAASQVVLVELCKGFAPGHCCRLRGGGQASRSYPADVGWRFGRRRLHCRAAAARRPAGRSLTGVGGALRPARRMAVLLLRIR